jgi:hypothetical protein
MMWSTSIGQASTARLMRNITRSDLKRPTDAAALAWSRIVSGNSCVPAVGPSHAKDREAAKHLHTIEGWIGEKAQRRPQWGRLWR